MLYSIWSFADYQDNSYTNTLDVIALGQKNVNLETDVASETVEINRPSVLVLPTRIPCEVRPLNNKRLQINGSFCPSHCYKHFHRHQFCGVDHRKGVQMIAYLGCSGICAAYVS